jgi:hypothetical protein
MSTETVIKQNAFGTKFHVATMSWEIGRVKILFDGGDLNEGMILLSTDKSQHMKGVTARQRF